MTKRKYQSKLTKHHIVPTSRGGHRLEDNIAQVPRLQHKHYHILFGNRKPDEIIDYLVVDFWDGQKEWVNKYQERYK